jgi:hypothetical protein
MPRGFALLFSVILIGFAVAEAQVEPRSTDVAEQFLFNRERAFTYLQFDHVGKGTRFDESEPPYRIWFRLVNNCRVPIVIRTFGVPDGSPVGEVGVLHNVIADLPYNGASGVPILSSDASPKLPENPVITAPMPNGYHSDVSSTATLRASESLLFSIPVNHLSETWHIEIPFRFDLPHKRPPHYEENIGGQPHMTIGYGLPDLPADARKQVEAGIK